MPRDEEIDEILGITRCARCGHRLEGEVECPFCSVIYGREPKREAVPKWVYLTACFLTSPLSVYFIVSTRRLNLPEKIAASLGCLFWILVYQFWL
jgi:hypothetical protein